MLYFHNSFSVLFTNLKKNSYKEVLERDRKKNFAKSLN